MRGSHGAASLPLQVKCTPAQGEPIPQANTSKGKTPRIEIREAIGFKLRPAGDSKPVHSQKTPAPSPATHYSRTATVPFVMSSTGPATDQTPANSPRLSAIGAADERRPPAAKRVAPDAEKAEARQVARPLARQIAPKPIGLPSIRGHCQLQRRSRARGDVSARAVARRACLPPALNRASSPQNREAPPQARHSARCCVQPDWRFGEFSTDLCHHATIATR
jgi:hypothetical protein